MLVQGDELSDIFEHVRQVSSATGGVTVAILCSLDPNAISACRILMRLLMDDTVAFQLLPVDSYEGVRASLSRIVPSDSLRSVFMINCGALSDVEEFGVPNSVTFYIFDEHRPVHLNNVFGDRELVVVADDMSTWNDILQLAGQGSLNQNNEDSEEYLSDGSLSRGKRQRSQKGSKSKKQKTNDVSGFGEPRCYVDGDPVVQFDKEASERLRGELEQLPDSAIDEYYSWAYCAQSSAVLMYELAKQMGRDDNEMLWGAIIGASEQYISGRIPERWYSQLRAILAGEVKDKNRDATDYGETRPAYEVDPIHFQIAAVEREFRFPHYRHWSLRKSMIASEYVGTRLRLWTDKGNDSLDKFMAKMGIPAEQSLRPYVMMDSVFKNVLPDRIHQFKNSFRLPDVCFPSFVLRHGFGLEISAMDVVNTLYSILASKPKGKVDEEGDLANDRFNLAADLLSMKPADMVNSPHFLGARDLLTDISETANSIIGSNGVIKTPVFNFVRLSRACTWDQRMAQPLVLRQLARYLAYAADAVEKRAKARRGMIVFSTIDVSSENETSELILCVGVGPGQGGVRDDLGARLREAAEKTGKDYRQDYFEQSAIVIKAGEFQKFLRNLKEVFVATHGWRLKNA